MGKICRYDALNLIVRFVCDYHHDLCLLTDWFKFCHKANDVGISMAMGIFQVGAGLILYTLGSKTVPAAELALLSLAEVLLGPFWVWLVLDERIVINTIIGGVVLLGALMGNALLTAQQKRPVLR